MFSVSWFNIFFLIVLLFPVCTAYASSNAASDTASIHQELKKTFEDTRSEELERDWTSRQAQFGRAPETGVTILTAGDSIAILAAARKLQDTDPELAAQLEHIAVTDENES